MKVGRDLEVEVLQVLLLQVLRRLLEFRQRDGIADLARAALGARRWGRNVGPVLIIASVPRDLREFLTTSSASASAWSLRVAPGVSEIARPEFWAN